MTDIDDYKKYSTLGILILITVLAFFIVKPFFVSIIGAAILAYLFHPLFLRLRKYVKKEWVAALIICVLIILAVIIPALIIIKSLATQAIGAYTASSGYLNKEDESRSGLLSFKEKIGIDIKIDDILLSVASFFADTSKKIITSLPNKILNFFIMIFMLYYLLKEGEVLSEKIENMIPLKKGLKAKILDETKEVTRAVIYGSLLTALIQGIVGGIGFAIFGIPSPIFWGFLMALFALIPMVGTGIIWVPAAIILLVDGIINSEGILIGKGIALLIYGILVISLIDNFIKPKLIGSKVRMHPAIILIGILGGLSFFGITGIILGPLILALFTTLIKIYGEEHGI